MLHLQDPFLRLAEPFLSVLQVSRAYTMRLYSVLVGLSVAVSAASWAG